MRKITTATVLLAVIGSGGALAQGCIPGQARWQSGWHSAIATPQAHPQEKITTRPDSRAALARSNGSIPVAGNPQSRSRGG